MLKTHKSKKRLKTILLLVLLFFIGREFVPFEITLFKSYLNSSQNTSFDKSSYKLPNDSLFYNRTKLNLDSIADPVIRIGGLRTIDNSVPWNATTTKDTIYHHASLEPEISVLRYIPFVKIVDFSVNTPLNFYVKFIKNNEIHVVSKKMDFSNSGTIKVFGLCSGKKVENLILQHVEAKVYDLMIQSTHEALNQ